MTEKEIYNIELKYYMDGSNMVRMNGDPNIYTNFMHAYNTWLNYFWSSYFSGDWWAQDQFLCHDIKETNKKLIELFNSSEDNVTIGILSFIGGIKPMPAIKWNKNYTYPNQMTFYDKNSDEHGYHPNDIYGKTMELLKHFSVQKYAREDFKASGLIYGTINVTS